MHDGDLARRALADLDDIETLSVYADWLIGRGDPRGEFIAVQLAIEAQALPEAQLLSLYERKRALIEQHAERWLGPIASVLRADDLPYQIEWEFQRGFLASLAVDGLRAPPEALADALIAATETQYLRQLSLSRCCDGSELVFAQVPFPRVCTFAYGDGTACMSGGGCETKIIANMPVIEDLSVSGRNLDTGALLSMPMERLRVLSIEATDHYDTRPLAKNASLRALQSLSFFSHSARSLDSAGYLRLAHIEDIAKSPHLASLRRLTLKLCTAGDTGCRVLVDSGLLARLEALDLSCGEITDAGATILAGAIDPTHLRWLDLSYNQLTESGSAKLRMVMGDRLAVSPQSPVGDRVYLYMGDME